jgi:predicted nucleic acid-binding protein
MTEVCIDASFLIRLLIGGKRVEAYSDLWQNWHQKKIQVVAPRLIFYEACNVLYRLQKSKQIESAQNIFATALKLDIKSYDQIQLHYQAIALSQQLHLSATYDAHYLALSTWLNIDFYTADKKLFNAIHHQFPHIHLIN